MLLRVTVPFVVKFPLLAIEHIFDFVELLIVKGVVVFGVVIANGVHGTPY